MSLPTDPIILLSYVNTKLRDQYSSLDEFCRAEDVNKEDLEERLRAVGFEYIAQINQFR